MQVQHMSVVVEEPVQAAIAVVGAAPHYAETDEVRLHLVLPDTSPQPVPAAVVTAIDRVLPRHLALWGHRAEHGLANYLGGAL